MSARFEETLIRHCAATLAGHKCGSLFSYRPQAGESLSENAAELDGLLREKGIRVRVLRERDADGLVYVYRPRMLEERLHQTDIRAFLSEMGYTAFDPEAALETLSHAVCAGTDFPHEIGVFLGYPLEDVIGFIRNKGQCFCCLGCWKAYSNEAQARRVFALYEKCRNVYLSCYRRGFGVARLTVAA